MNTHIYLLSVSKTGGAARLRPRLCFQGDWLVEMGFVGGALVQALPEPDGIVFNLCNENIRSYSDLSNATQALGGGLIQVYVADAKDYKGVTFVTSGQYIHSAGLAMGDALIAKYDYGVIRVRKIDPRKLGCENVKVITTTYIKKKYTKDLIPKVRLCGYWLGDIGFEIGTIATAESAPGVMTFTLQKDIGEYSAFQKYVRGNKMKIIQVYKEPHSRTTPIPSIGITGSCVDRAGFEIGDTLAAAYENGVIKLQKLDFDKLGLT